MFLNLTDAHKLLIFRAEVSCLGIGGRISGNWLWSGDKATSPTSSFSSQLNQELPGKSHRRFWMKTFLLETWDYLYKIFCALHPLYASLFYLLGCYLFFLKLFNEDSIIFYAAFLYFPILYC